MAGKSHIFGLKMDFYICWSESIQFGKLDGVRKYILVFMEKNLLLILCYAFDEGVLVRLNVITSMFSSLFLFLGRL